jgi:hypothetical protein
VAGGYRLAAAKVHSPHIVVFVEFGAGHARVKLVIIVFATGFDAMTGPLKALNLKAAGAYTRRSIGTRPGPSLHTSLLASTGPPTR